MFFCKRLPVCPFVLLFVIGPIKQRTRFLSTCFLVLLMDEGHIMQIFEFYTLYPSVPKCVEIFFKNVKRATIVKNYTHERTALLKRYKLLNTVQYVHHMGKVLVSFLTECLKNEQSKMLFLGRDIIKRRFNRIDKK